MKEIQLTKGKVTRVDDADFAVLNIYKWHLGGRKQGPYYAIRTVRVAGKRTTLRMHQQIKGGTGFDHEDNDGLNNQRYNLRPANSQQNNHNATKQQGTSSQFKGVYKRGNKYRAQITLNYEKRMLGTFDTETDAAKRYDAEALILFGKFAKLNFPVI